MALKSNAISASPDHGPGKHWVSAKEGPRETGSTAITRRLGRTVAGRPQFEATCGRTSLLELEGMMASQLIAAHNARWNATAMIGETTKTTSC
jgi:hypothetical protein